MSAAYNEQTRRLFFAPQHVGNASVGAGQRVLQGSAAESAGGTKVALSAALVEGRLVELRFRVFGCPHTIAAAEWMCERFEGQPLSALASFPVRDCMRALEVPAEKTGRMLLLEDAATELCKSAQTTDPTNKTGN